MVRDPAAIYVLTNSRAEEPTAAYRTVFEAATAARDSSMSSPIVLRGDSTLRAHLLEEYLGVRDALAPGRELPMLLVPALPAAGRITVDGVHLIEQDGKRIPLHDTPYARDPQFAYADARIVQWAEDRSGGYFARSASVEIGLNELRTRGSAVVADALLRIADNGSASVCVPDAESQEDLTIIADGLRGAWRSGAEVVVRCAPAFAGAIARNTATRYATPSSARHGLLVVCGSYVPRSTRQLARLVEAHPGVLIEVDVLALAGQAPAVEILRVARAAQDQLAATGLAIVATPRDRPS